MTLRLSRIAALCALAAVLAAACSKPPASETTVDAADGQKATTAAPSRSDAGTGGTTRGTGGSASAAQTTGTSPKITPPRGATKTLGVTDKEITVAYYWKGDRTRTSPYLKGTGQEYLVDEAEAFRTWIDYINANPKGDIMGYRYDLHGRKLRGVVIEAGDSPEDNVAAVTDIKAAKPFAAVAAHGSISAYACPLLAAAGIFNLWTYDLDFDLEGRSKGWCLPGGATFDDQVSVMERYLTERVAKTKTSTGAERVFGLLYAEYPGLISSAPKIATRLKAKGLKIAAVNSISSDLAEAQQQATTIAARFRANGVNTMIIPDAGAPLGFTPAAQAIGYDPDYMVWPCSGQDAPAMVRLYTATQWAGAQGLTCYAQDLMVDLRHGEASRKTEWYEKYRATSDREPAAQAPFVYGALLPLVVGVTEAGSTLTPERFLDGLGRFKSFRYASATGQTTASNHMRLALGEHAHPLTNDFTILRWSSAQPTDGGAGAGAYVFPENGRRYSVNADF